MTQTNEISLFERSANWLRSPHAPTSVFGTVALASMIGAEVAEITGESNASRIFIYSAVSFAAGAIANEYARITRDWLQ
ncbi:MAG TPA: hypothetical protein VLG47_04120 [Candidatus Saccharimonadales bacterium]|nr:hypothetical protein [Candidatus Saccharimonadales bacterium]